MKAKITTPRRPSTSAPKARRGPEPGAYSPALVRIQRHFPQVKHLDDATAPIIVQVDASDVAGAKPKDPTNCAFARACRRHQVADGAIVGIGTTWLIRGDTAFRFRTSVGLSREITTFDRHSEFAPAMDYRLAGIPESNRREAQREYQKAHYARKGPGNSTGANATRKIIHRTANIRVIRDL